MAFKRLSHHRFKNIDQTLGRVVWGTIAPYLFKQLGSPKRLLDPAAGHRARPDGSLIPLPSQTPWQSCNNRARTFHCMPYNPFVLPSWA
jgi:hypothetical protein